MADPTFTFLPLGAILQNFSINNQNIVLGFPKQEQYVSHNAPYFGETIGRYANRISSAKINSLNNGQSYQLAANNATNSLHGGNEGWGKKIWKGPEVLGLRAIEGLQGGELEGGESVKFTYRSVHLEEGFPGTVDISVIYTTGTQKTSSGKEVKVLGIEYEAVLVDDGSGVEETVINMTNHSYFNLNPTAPESPSISGTQITLHSTNHLPLSALGLPTSTTPTAFPGLTANSAFTCTTSRPLVDDCFTLSPPVPPSAYQIDTRSAPLALHVSAHHPSSEIHLEVHSTEPSFQFYTGIYIDVPAVEGVRARGQLSGFCVEPGRYVNAVNEDEWRDQVVLKRGEVYGSRIVYRGWSDV